MTSGPLHALECASVHTAPFTKSCSCRLPPPLAWPLYDSDIHVTEAACGHSTGSVRWQPRDKVNPPVEYNQSHIHTTVETIPLERYLGVPSTI